MSQVTGKKVAVTPMPTPTGSEGAIINSWNTSDDKTKNAPSMQLVKNDLDTINDNLTQIAWRDATATTLEALINGFVNSSLNTLQLGQTKFIRVDNRNDLWFDVTITKDIGGDVYTGTALSLTDATVRYTFRKRVSGGASTVISPFSGKDDLIRFNFYREYGINSESMMLYITDAGYFPSNESSPLFTVSKTCVSTSDLLITTITLTANKATTIKFKIDYTEEGRDSNVNYRASIEIKHNNTDILTKHKEPKTATSNTIEQNITLALNDTITLNFYAAYGSWFGNIIVK